MNTLGQSRIFILTVAALLIAACGGGGGGKKTVTDPDPDPAPTTSSVSPATGTVGTELSIVGANFRSGVRVFVGGIEATSVERESSTQLYAHVPAGIDFPDIALDVRVLNSDGTDVTLADAFTAIVPELSYVNSATKPSGNIGSTVILEGIPFGDLQGIGQVLFSDGAGGTVEAVIAAEDDWINDFIVTTVPDGADDGDVVVVTATGTSNALHFDVTSGATFSPSVINWTSTEALPFGVSGHDVLFLPIDDTTTGETNQFVHSIGGAIVGGIPVADVNLATVLDTGHVSPWAATTSLPAARAFHGVIAATPFNSKVAGNGEVYVLGGIEEAGGQPVTTVYRASLNEDGTLKEILDADGVGTGTYWAETTPLPVALHSMGVAIFRGAIYISGGATSTDSDGDGTLDTDNVPVDTVYRARPDETGELSAWEEMIDTPLPSARAHHDMRSFGGFLYAVGGDGGAVEPDAFSSSARLDEVAYVAINLRNGDLVPQDDPDNLGLPAWTINANALGKTRSKHSMLIAGGFVFVTSGIYEGIGLSGSSENTYAQIFADGSVDTFAGATGDDTLQVTGGANLFNQAALSYIDANGVAHVMVIGGDNVDLPGDKRSTVMFY